MATIKQVGSVWQVWQDGKIYGTYTTEEDAIHAKYGADNARGKK